MRHLPYRWLSTVLLAAAACACSHSARAELAKSAVMENNVGYLRVSQTDTNLPQEIQSVINHWEATNKIAGIAVDLRFANGSDSGSVKSTEAVLEAEKLPLAILVNAQTSGDAAALADDLRAANAGLVFGSATGSLQPDIPVSIGTNDERELLKAPYGVMTENDTNSVADTNLLQFVDIDHTSEADLVREKVKDGDQDDTTAQPVAPKPYIRDPVLAHGVDFIKGLAALHLNKG
jgi:hypothetical protein